MASKSKGFTSLKLGSVASIKLIQEPIIPIHFTRGTVVLGLGLLGFGSLGFTRFGSLDSRLGFIELFVNLVKLGVNSIHLRFIVIHSADYTDQNTTDESHRHVAFTHSKSRRSKRG